jgi:hypothetical protein
MSQIDSWYGKLGNMCFWMRSFRIDHWSGLLGELDHWMLLSPKSSISGPYDSLLARNTGGGRSDRHS